MFSKLLQVSIHLVLGQVSAFLPSQGTFAEFPADITEEVIAAIVNVKFVLVVEVLRLAEEAVGMRLVDVLMQWLVPVE